MNTLPLHWVNKGDLAYHRVDGVVVKLCLRAVKSGESEGEREIGWQVQLPIKAMPNGHMYQDHFLAASLYPTVAEVLKKTDQQWEPPGHIKPMIPKEWFGHDLEQLAREAHAPKPE